MNFSLQYLNTILTLEKNEGFPFCKQLIFKMNKSVL